MKRKGNWRKCRLDDKDEAILKQFRLDESIPAWGFRFLQTIPGVQMVLSGMSDMTQMEDNVKTFAAQKSLRDCETSVLLSIAEGMKDSVPCTACRYCSAECPMTLDIPMLLATYNEIRFSPAINVAMRLEGLPDDKQPSACIACGKCAKMCPQKINIPEAMKDIAMKLSGIPKWADICHQREEAAKRVREGR